MDKHGNLEADDISSTAVPGLDESLRDPELIGNPLVQRVARDQQRRDIVSDVASVPIASDIKVDPDKLLHAAKIIQDVLDTQGEPLLRRLDELTMQAPGFDPVSTEATTLWNRLLVADHDSFAHRVREYLHSLRNLVGNLAETARTYGHTDEEIHAALRKVTLPGGTEN